LIRSESPKGEEKMKFLIVGGFLGSGKTSFLLHLAKHLVQVRGVENVVILENEVGQVSVDDKILTGSGLQVRGMFAGCVCCTMAGELPVNVRRIQTELNPDWIIMEATGVAFPYSIRENLERFLEEPPQVICLVDAKRWRKLLGPMEQLLPHQLRGADKILINKIDLVTAEELEWVKASIASFNETAELNAFCAMKTVPEEILDRIADWEP